MFVQTKAQPCFVTVSEHNLIVCVVLFHQKEEMGEVLHEVDFNQLKIENQQYLEKIDEKNQDLLRLKLMTTNVQQILNTYKVTS